MARVSLTACADYDPARVEVAVRRAIDRLGGMDAFLKPGQRVLLKPNLVRSAPPENAVSTHPSIVAAVAKLVVEVGANPIIVESPGGPYSAGLLRGTYRRSGMTWAAEVSGAELNFDVDTVQVSHPEAYVLHRLDLVKPLLEADAVINLPKLKTHNLTALTLAVKNLFGLVPGALKIGYHAKLRERERFCQGLVDILTYVKPALNLVDAIVAMEGEGPSGGDPRQIGAIIASTDALAVDMVSAALVGLDPLDVLTTRVAAARGLTSGRLDDLELVGERLEDLRVDDFRRGIEFAFDPGLLPRPLRRFLGAGESATTSGGRGRVRKGLLSSARHRVVLASTHRHAPCGKKCTGCGFCARHCPVEAIQVVDGVAQMDTRKCIRCYCCHELCPELAVELRRPWLGRLVLGR